MGQARAVDVAAAILERFDSLDTIKLQKLVYYAQAWHITWCGEPLFDDAVEAWDNGPVVRDLFHCHRGARAVSRLGRGSSAALPESAEGVLAFVLAYYGSDSGADLVLHVHEEAPWVDAYHGGGQNTVITPEAMREYYSSIELNDQSWLWRSGMYRQAEAAEAEAGGSLTEDELLDLLR